MKEMAAAAMMAVIIFAAGCATMPPKVEPAGEPKSSKTEALETAAGMIQRNTPAEELKIYLSGLHVMKNNAAHQMDAHHFCRQVNEELAQCAIFDGNGRQANLVGIEYIISERLFNGLPQDEKRFWHPHNYEILSGQLVAPWLPDAAELELMAGKMNSYGKTWHVWDTGMFSEQGNSLPLGAPELAWSFNRDREANPALLEHRDKSQNIDSAAKRKAREGLLPLARPQQGVTAMEKDFPSASTYPPGVAEKR